MTSASISSAHFALLTCRANVPAASIQVSLPQPNVGVSRERLRKAIVALSQSDAFLDILSEELYSAGLLE